MGFTDTTQQAFDRAQEIKQFEESKLGVKGLVDSGLTSIPPLFIHPPETLSSLKPAQPRSVSVHSIPTIDLSGCESGRRPFVIKEVVSAARELGFFQVVNHGVPTEVMDRTITAVKAFNEEEPMEAKAKIYRREFEAGVKFFSNVDLFHSKAASWRDSLQIRLEPKMEVEEIPEVCRNEVVEYNQHMQRLGGILMGLLSEGLGLNPGKLRELMCPEHRNMVGNYYPPCPQPDLTVGLESHTDPGVFAVLLQDHLPGLQVKYGDEWVDVPPVPGALVVNIGDVLQIMSNDVYKSADHRALANPHQEARLTIVVFYNLKNPDLQIGPFPELVSSDKPAAFRQLSMKDYLRGFYGTGLDVSLVNYFRV